MFLRGWLYWLTQFEPAGECGAKSRPKRTGSSKNLPDRLGRSEGLCRRRDGYHLNAR